VGAMVINHEMKIACVKALADLTLEETSDSVSSAYRGETFRFGPKYLLPKPFDRRLMSRIAVNVARAAMDSGVARRPIKDLAAYRRKLQDYRFRTSALMRPIFDLVRQQPRRILFAEGESSRVLQALQVIVEEDLCRPVLVGRRDRIEEKLGDLGMRLRPDQDFGILDPGENKQREQDWQCARDWLSGSGITSDGAKELVLVNGTVLSAVRLRRRMVDGVICGVRGDFSAHLNYIRSIVGCDDHPTGTAVFHRYPDFDLARAGAPGGRGTDGGEGRRTFRYQTTGCVTLSCGGRGSRHRRYATSRCCYRDSETACAGPGGDGRGRHRGRFVRTRYRRV
jgi:malate dehydrogenase (oxaloacetate-decarboxylating)(NADP+)